MRGCIVTSLAWKIGGFAVVLVVVLAALCFGAYQLGHSLAEAKGTAALAALQVDYSEERRAASDAYGTALASTLEKYQDEVARVTELDMALTTAHTALAAKASELRRRIAHVTSGSTHTFSLDFVSLFNEAIGADAAACPLSAAGAGGAAGSGSSGTAAGAGILAGVTEADLLEFMNYYGERCQRLEKKERAWIQLMADKGKI